MQLIREDDEQVDVRVRLDELILMFRLLTDAIENENYSFLAILPDFQRHEAESLQRRMAGILERLGLVPEPE